MEIDKRYTNLGGITSRMNKKLIMEIITLETHSTEIMTIYGCVTSLFERRHVRCAWWIMVTAVTAANAVEKPSIKVTKARDNSDGGSMVYHGGTRSPPMLLGVGTTKAKIKQT